MALDVTVDGVEGAALGVMSQGELHSLALSLFVPRATLPESPFRFIVIDDPVQSMDPSRVDGLARVLENASADRQVVVFTHDDRLPEAVRRLDIAAEIVEVTRRDASVVELRRALDPVGRYLEDALAVAGTADLPSSAAARVVPGLCRLGLEAACMEVVRRRRLTRGEPHAEVERALGDAERLMQLAALALFDDVERSGDVLPRLEREAGAPLAEALEAVRRGGPRGRTRRPRSSSCVSPASSRRGCGGWREDDDGEPHDLLALADGLLRRADPATAGLWPRASALLALAALEASVLRLWERRALDLQGCSMRTQLICLRSYLEDAKLAARTGHAWSALQPGLPPPRVRARADGRGAAGPGSRWWSELVRPSAGSRRVLQRALRIKAVRSSLKPASPAQASTAATRPVRTADALAARQTAQRLADPVVAELALVGRHGLGHAVRDHGDDVSRLERSPRPRRRTPRRGARARARLPGAGSASRRGRPGRAGRGRR